MAVKTLLLDVDGVLADFSSFMAPMLGLHRPFAPRTWQWRDVGVSEEAFAKGWKNFLAIENVWTRLEPLPALRELEVACVNGLHNKVDIIFLTARGKSRGDTTAHQTEAWLRKHVPSLANPSVVVVPHTVHKLDVARAVDKPALIDDHGPTIAMARPILRNMAVLYRQPWNRYEEEAYAVTGADSLSEFLQMCGLGEFCEP